MHANTMDKYKGKTKMVYDKLIIQGRKYTIENLDQLPDDLNLDLLFNKTDDNTIGYFGEHSRLSNFHDALFTQNGKMYANSEQTIQVARASMFDDDRSEHLIMQTSNPYKAKAVGNSVKGFNQQHWERDCEPVVRSILGVWKAHQ